MRKLSLLTEVMMSYLLKPDLLKLFRMVVYIQEIGRARNVMDMASASSRMDQITKVHGKMIYIMARVN